MDTATLILTLLTAFNLSVMVMKAYGDKFPQPTARAKHAGWLQGWRNTQKPLQRYWIQVAIMFAIMLLFNFAGQMFAGFLVFVRLIVFVLGYKRAKLQIGQAAAPQTPLATDRPHVAQAEVPQGYATAVEPPPAPQATISQTLSPPAGKRPMGKGVWVLLIVIVAVVAAGGLGYLYSRSHPLDNYAGSTPDNSPASSDTSALSNVLGDSSDGTGSSGSSAPSAPAPQAAQAQQPVQAPSPQAMQQAVRQDMAAQAQGSGPAVTMNTYGNMVASFYPGKSSVDAIGDALVLIHSELTVMDMAPSGYPEYQVECESNGQCVGGTGTPMGTAADVAKEMFPVNPADVGQGGVTCNQYICNDGKGNVIGRNPEMQ